MVVCFALQILKNAVTGLFWDSVCNWGGEFTHVHLMSSQSPEVSLTWNFSGVIKGRGWATDLSLSIFIGYISEYLEDCNVKGFWITQNSSNGRPGGKEPGSISTFPSLCQFILPPSIQYAILQQ